jgi:leucyl aminopeptidase (aminopeptidase T)
MSIERWKHPASGEGLMNARRRIAGALVYLLLAPPLAAQEKTIPPFDFHRWARFIVRDFFDVQPHEKVVMMGDPYYYPEFLDALRVELMDARAIEVGTILFDGPEVFARRRQLQRRASDPEYKRLSDAAMRRLYENADVFLWLPYRYGTGSEKGDWRVLEHLVEGTNARGLHFHWIQGIDQLTQQEIETLSKIYADALDIDYKALSAHQDRVIAALKGRRLRITTPAGTDLTVHVAEDSWIHKNDGRMDRARAARARAVRDREMELPAGALRFVPDVATTEGRLVVPAWRGGKDLNFEFRDGRVVKVGARIGEAQVLETWARETGDKDRVAEMVIGLNPRLPAKGPGSGVPYYGYGAGVLRIALGDNWESGGANRSSLEAWFWFTDATVTAGETPLVKEGRLIIR